METNEQTYPGLEAALRRVFESRVINPEAQTQTNISMQPKGPWTLSVEAEPSSPVELHLVIKDNQAIERIKTLKTYDKWNVSIDYLDHFDGKIMLGKDVEKGAKYVQIILHKVLGVPFGTLLNFETPNTDTFVPQAAPVAQAPTIPSEPKPVSQPEPTKPVSQPLSTTVPAKSGNTGKSVSPGIIAAAVASVLVIGGILAYFLLCGSDSGAEEYQQLSNSYIGTPPPEPVQEASEPQEVVAAVTETPSQPETVNHTVNNAGYEYVDLGLPSGTLWAASNLGADEPKYAGSHFAWGETSDKDEYSQQTYRLSLGASSLPARCDAASVQWGGDWQVPSMADWQELNDYCSWSWYGAGYKVVGRNSNYIYLPAAGYQKDWSTHRVGEQGDYWSSTADGSAKSYEFVIKDGSHKVSSDKRYYGASIRPVIKR